MDRLLRLETPLVTTESVLLEVADPLCTPVSRIQTVAFINSLRLLKSQDLRIVHKYYTQFGYKAMFSSQRSLSMPIN